MGPKFLGNLCCARATRATSGASCVAIADIPMPLSQSRLLSAAMLVLGLLPTAFARFRVIDSARATWRLSTGRGCCLNSDQVTPQVVEPYARIDSLDDFHAPADMIVGQRLRDNSVGLGSDAGRWLRREKADSLDLLCPKFVRNTFNVQQLHSSVNSRLAGV